MGVESGTFAGGSRVRFRAGEDCLLDIFIGVDVYHFEVVGEGLTFLVVVDVLKRTRRVYALINALFGRESLGQDRNRPAQSAQSYSTGLPRTIGVVCTSEARLTGFFLCESEGS